MKPIATGATLRPIPRLASGGGVAHFGNGFRPFFLAGAIYAATEILVWVPYFFDSLKLPTAFSAVERQAHEMPYGRAQ
jgi:uncharacterized protein involved in response to NO